MRTIHQLPQHIVSQIAAGEVIERPAYAVKELIENAIDANADYITITIEEAGLKKISITDNGIGMSKEDLLESWKPHTTSKLSGEKETSLIGIRSLGFRGEALASIAAISDLTIRSRIQNQSAGYEIQLSKGEIKKATPVGMPTGTTIIVEQLFHTVPVRKKFLQSSATEFRHMLEIVIQYAFAFPLIRFFLTHNKKNILDLPKGEDMQERMHMLLGKDLLAQYIPIAIKDSYIEINGYIAKPQAATTTRSKQYIFVNNRRIYDRNIAATIKEAYGNLLEQKSFPLFLLFFTIPYEMVDVNVHPKKDKVTFAHKEMLLQTIQKVVKQTLEEKNITFSFSRWGNDPLYDKTRKKLYSPKSGSMQSFTSLLLKDQTTPWNVKDTMQKDASVEQIHNLYIVIQSNNGMLLIDQHAAHERILFEQYTQAFTMNTQLFEPYILEEPEEIPFTPTEQALFEEYETLLKKLGFIIEISVGANNYLPLRKITAVPQFLKDRNRKAYIRELLESLQEKDDQALFIDSQTKKILQYLACRNAIKAGEILTKKQMRELVHKLEETKHNATCPHGRPTKISVSLQELRKLFKRT